MPTEQIQTNQIAGFTGSGARTAMQVFTLTGGTADISTNSFGFVIGPVMIELLVGTSDVNGTAVYSVLWNSMRSFSGSKTADITDRFARGPGNGGFIRMAVDRIGGGFGLRISRPFDGTDTAPDGTGVASFTARNWPNPGVLRVTVWEDTTP
jgi:hypothetical protein